MSDDKRILFWDPTETARWWLEEVYPVLEDEDKQWYGDDPGAKIFEDSSFWEWEFETTVEALDQILRERNMDGEWLLVQASGLGWMRRSGYKEVRAKSGEDLLRDMLPDTECIWYLYDEGGRLKFVNSHHDASGEVYYVETIENYVEENVDIDAAVAKWVDDAVKRFNSPETNWRFDFDGALEYELDKAVDRVDFVGGERVYDAVKERMWAHFEAHYQHTAEAFRVGGLLFFGAECLTEAPEFKNPTIQNLELCAMRLRRIAGEIEAFLDRQRPAPTPEEVDEIMALVGDR